MKNELLENLAGATTSGFLWSFLAIVIALAGLWSLIFVYHWYHYQTDKKMFILAGGIYGIGLIILLTLNIIVIFIFNNA